MSDKTALQILGEETRPYFGRFWEVIEPFQRELWNYCRKITGNPWDGEDLFQDTVLKMFTSLSALSHREHPIHPRAFLFRVATNHWIDTCRKRKGKMEEWSDHLVTKSSEDVSIALEIQGAFETLLTHLPPKQTVVLVLMDAFQFTANEAAEVIGTTEGAVNAALFRARSRLRQLKSDELSADNSTAAADTQPDESLVKRYVEYFNKRDFQGIADLLAEHAVFSFVTQSSKEYGKRRIMNESHHPSHYDRPDLYAVVHELWGRKAVIFYKGYEQGEPTALNEVLTIETEDNHIIGINGYFFCPQFMDAAAQELGVPREEWQWAE
ncbi:RNA polymerase sigma factor [Cohnella terricola]|uniref:RNA polymerase sigma factor n=1 Tax=Cohnella terricola TaxID=1289167 RepID=A0A559JA08_9BACL|nr:RNA polymerase sigma factor [Cohnella terricola]TVX96701.1 RNA polymerase sigma factor [Cohnella terricola]